MCKKKSYVVSIAIVMTIAAVMFFPVMGIAGSLEPSAAPAPTMKTLDQIPPTWSQKLPAAQRFELVLDGAAVLDKETGLVWEQSPGSVTYYWTHAMTQCRGKSVGSRRGWRLPTVEELDSLVDPSVPSPGPTLPSGHPFANVQSSYYWSANTISGLTTHAWSVRFDFGGVAGYDKATFSDGIVWCVRGGQGYDAY